MKKEPDHNVLCSNPEECREARNRLKITFDLMLKINNCGLPESERTEAVEELTSHLSSIDGPELLVMNGFIRLTHRLVEEVILQKIRLDFEKRTGFPVLGTLSFEYQDGNPIPEIRVIFPNTPNEHLN